MTRKILSILAGVVTGWLIIFIGDAATHVLFPPAEGTDFTNQEEFRAFVESIPAKVFILMLSFWLLAAFIGGFVSAKINKAGWKRFSIITGSVLLAATILNLLMISHPLWMVIIAVLLIVPAAYFGGKLAS
jgi:hypothetical protein